MTTDADAERYGQWVETEARRVWDSFAPWRRDIGSLRRVISIKPIPYSGSAAISARAATQLEMAQAQFTQFASGRVARMIDNLVDRMVNGNCQIEPRTVSRDRAEQDRIETMVAICESWKLDLDRSVQRRREGTSWRHQIASTFAFPGSGVALPILGKGKGGRGEVRCEMIDPMNVAYTFGDEDPDIIVTNKRMGLNAARGYLKGMWYKDEPDYVFPEYRIKKDQKTVDVMTVWILEAGELSRACVVDGKYAGTHVIGKRDSHIIKIINCHTPTSTMQSFEWSANTLNPGGVEDAFIIEHAQPFIYSLRYIHENANVVVSAAYASLARDLDPALLMTSDDGTDVPEDQLSAGGRIRSFTRNNLEIKAVDRASSTIAQNLQALQDVIQREYDEVMNPMLFGARESGQSGFSQTVQASHAETVFNETADACMGLTLAVMEEFLYQWRNDYPSAIFSVDDDQSVEAADLPNEYREIDVDWHPDLGTTMQQIAAAQQMIALGLPKSFAYSRALNIPNPQNLIEQQRDELAEGSPIAQAARQSKMALADWLAAQQQASHKRSPEQRRIWQMAADNAREVYRIMDAQFHALAGPPAGQGTPAAAPGIDNTVMPPQMGSANPNLLAASVGQPATGMGGQGGVGPAGG